MIGAVAETDWLPPQLDRDINGYVCTGRDLSRWPLDRGPFALETSIPGIFCAGDVRHGSIKRVASGVGEGSMSIAFIPRILFTLQPSAHSPGREGSPMGALLSRSSLRLVVR